MALDYEKFFSPENTSAFLRCLTLMTEINFERLHKACRGDIMRKSRRLRKTFLLRQFQWAKFTTTMPKNVN